MSCYPKQTNSWDVKVPRTIVLLESEANFTYKRISREAIRATIDHGKMLQNNTVDQSAVMWLMGSTADWYLITNNISNNLST